MTIQKIPESARKIRKLVNDFFTYNAVKLCLEFQVLQLDESLQAFTIHDTKGLGKLGEIEIHDYDDETGVWPKKPSSPTENEIRAYLTLYPPDPAEVETAYKQSQLWQETDDLIFDAREEKYGQIVSALYAYLAQVCDTAVTRPDRDAENKGAATVKTYFVPMGITYLEDWLERHHSEFFRILYEKNLIKGNLVSLRNGNNLRIIGDKNSPLVDLFSLDLPAATLANYIFNKNLGVIAQQDKQPVDVLNYGLSNLGNNQTRLEAECVYSEFLPFYDWLLEELKRDYPNTREIGQAQDTAVSPTENLHQQDLKPVTNNIYVSGDYVVGDKIDGDKVEGNKTTVGNIADLEDGETAVSTPNDSTLTPEERKYRSELLKILRRNFGKSDLKTLYFELGWEYGQFESGGKDAQARALVEKCFREARQNELVDLIAQYRPKITLPKSPE